MTTDGIITYSSNNPCAEIELPRSERKYTLENEDPECTVPACVHCGCPDLIAATLNIIDIKHEYWRCLSCETMSISAMAIKPEEAMAWRLPKKNNIIDMMITL